MSKVRFSAYAIAEVSTSVLDAVASSSREDLSCSAYSLSRQSAHHVNTSKIYCASTGEAYAWACGL